MSCEAKAHELDSQLTEIMKLQGSLLVEAASKVSLPVLEI